MKRILLLISLVYATQAIAATRYVDATSPGGNDGLSWATAWDHPTQITGVVGGDIIYISGGTTSKTYNFSSPWSPPQGSPGNQVIIRNGRDVGHRGLVIFNRLTGADYILEGANLKYVFFDFYDESTQKLRFDGAGGHAIYDGHDPESSTNDSVEFTLNGAIFVYSRLKLYDSRKTHIGWCVFNPSGTLALTDGNDGWIIGIGRGDTTGFGNNSFHDCVVNVTYRRGVDAAGDNGDDIMANLGALDVYNNRFISRLSATTGRNHQDGLQSDGYYFRIFNNYFENLANYCIFAEFWSNAVVHSWYIYNNVFNYADSVLTSQPSAAITFDHGFPNFQNIKIVNNTFRGGGQATYLTGTSWSNTCEVRNNITATGTGGLNMNIWQSGGPNNAIRSPNVTGVPLTYFANAAAGNFALTSAAVGAIDTGVNLSSLFTTDLAGTSRPQGAGWDMGAYEFTNVVGPGSLSFSVSNQSVSEGAGTVAITVNRLNGSAGAVGVSYSTSNGTATSGADYTTTSGTLSWASGDANAKTITIPILQDTDVEGNESLNVTIASPSGGATLGAITNLLLTISDDEGPVIPLMSGLAFSASIGLVEAPFTISGITIFQSVDTSAADGGRARYRVTIPSTGPYSMTMVMDCPSTGADSIYVDWDQEPAETTSVFDVGVTTGAQTKTVTWRGTGGPGTPQFNPKFWTLTAGVHTLYIRGREPGAVIGLITVAGETPPDTTAPTPNPPTWEQVPIAPAGVTGQSRLTMTVAPCTDPSAPVQYFFHVVGLGGTDSGWVAERTYVAEGLTAGNSYSIQVKARDSVGNETAYTTAVSATTSSGQGTINATNLIIRP